MVLVFTNLCLTFICKVKEFKVVFLRFSYACIVRDNGNVIVPFLQLLLSLLSRRSSLDFVCFFFNSLFIVGERLSACWKSELNG